MATDVRATPSPVEAQMKRIAIEVPGPAKSSTLDADDEDPSDDDGFIEGYAESIGVSIGKEQSRLMSPTTPAAEKSAALDRANSWGFFDGEEEATHAEVLQNTLEHALVGMLEQPEVQGAQDLNRSPAGLPTRRIPTIPAESKLGEGLSAASRYQAGRPRATTTNSILDSGIRKFFSTLSFPALPEPRIPGQRISLSSGSPRREGEPTQKRHGRSNSLLAGKWSWPLQHRSSSQSRGQPLKQPSPPPGAKPPAVQWDGPIQDMLSGKPPALPRTSLVLRRSASVDSALRHRLSRQTTMDTIGDDVGPWEHINTQVNSRGKAIRDTIQDSLPNMPNISLSSLLPEYALRSLRESNIQFTRSMSTVFRSDSPGSELAKSRTPSPAKGARSKWPSLDSALEILEGDIVVMGGYRGSVLRSAEAPHRQLWVPVKVGLNIRKVDLEVGLEPEDEENMEKRIFASGMLTHIGPVDISRRLLKKLRQCKNAKEGKLRVHEYAYDWRLSPALLSRRLIEFLERLPCNSSATPKDKRGAVILAHSLGGLITRHAVNHRPELFAGVTSVGTPQHCVNILGPLRNGDEVLLSSRVLTAQVNFTFRTSFLLLPDTGQCFIDKHTKEQYRVDFFDAEAWRRHALSPCVAPSLPAFGGTERRSIMGALSNSFPSLLHPSSSAGNLKSLASSQHPVFSAADAASTKIEHALHAQEGGVGMRMQPPLLPHSISSTIPIAAATAYLERTLAETAQFKRELHHRASLEAQNRYPPHAIMFSTSVPTVYGARVVGREGIRRADAFDDLAFASGDGVVLARAAMMPPGYKVAAGGRVRTQRGHVGMLGDLEAVGKCLLAVLGGRAKGVGLPDDAKAEPTAADQTRAAASPAAAAA